MKRLFNGIFCLLCFLPQLLAAQPSHCDRIIYPKRQIIDVSNVAKLVNQSEKCMVDKHIIRCKDSKTNEVICLKCQAGKIWQHDEADIYKCR